MPLNELHPAVSVRPARPDDPDDAAFLAELTPRLVAGAPAWHTPANIAAGAARHLREALLAQRETEALLLAEDSTGQRLGLLYANTSTDYFTGEPHGHISDLIVAQPAEGRGIGMILLQAAESWARSRGYRVLTLNVFPANTRALGLYERSGYEAEGIRLRKAL